MAERVDRRAEIVQAAFRQIAEVGFEGLRLRQVADEVGIDHSTLHHYFPGKKEIVAAVAAYAIGQFKFPLPQDAGPVETLRASLGHLRAVLDHTPEVFVVTAELELRARRDPVVRAITAEHETRWRASTRHWLAEGRDQGAWAPGVEVDTAVELIIAVIKGVSLAPEVAGFAFAQLDALLVAGQN